jgi:hypothetical protein
MNLFNYTFSRSKTQAAINYGLERPVALSAAKGAGERLESGDNCRRIPPQKNRNTYIKYQKNKYVEWHRYYSNSGKPFYYSPLTHETQWEEPLYNSIIFDTNSPSFTSNDCVVINPPALERVVALNTSKGTSDRLESIVNSRRIPFKSNNITKNIYKNKNIPPKFGFTLQHFEEIIMKNVEKTLNNGIENSLPQYKLESGEFITGVQYKSDLDIMEEGYWLNSFE